MKYLLYIVIALSACILQISIGDMISVKSIVPDLTIIALCFISLREGRRAGALFGFLIGLVMDSLTGGLFGAGPFIYTVTGFIAGSALGYRSFQHIYDLISICGLIFIIYFIFSHFILFMGHVTFLKDLLYKVLPSFGYTLVVLLFLLLCIPQSVWHGRQFASFDIFGKEL